MPASHQSCGCRLHRRQLLQFAGAAGMAALLPPATALAQKTRDVETLLLVCNERGVWPSANTYMNTRQNVGRFRPIEVEGAAIGLVAEQYRASRARFWEEVMSAVAFEQTRRVIALNHRGCSAMKVAYGLNKIADKLIETETHRYALQEFRKRLAERNAELEVEIGLIGLDGKVEMFK
jgi:hypothetical protein